MPFSPPAALIRALDDAISFLRSYGEDGWADWIAADRERLLAGDAEALDHILLAFGGVASLNDLWIHPLNGHRIPSENVRKENERLVRLVNSIRNRAWFARWGWRMTWRWHRARRWLTGSKSPVAP